MPHMRAMQTIDGKIYIYSIIITVFLSLKRTKKKDDSFIIIKQTKTKQLFFY